MALLNSDAFAIFGKQYFPQREKSEKSKELPCDPDVIGEVKRKAIPELPAEPVTRVAPMVDPFPQLLVPGDSYAMQDLLKPSYFEDADARVHQSIW